MQAIDINLLSTLFGQLERRGVKYGYGAKADSKAANPRSTGSLSTPEDTIDQIDCSGFIRYVIYQSTSGSVSLPDGSQNQREWFENVKDPTIVKAKSYADLADAAADTLFISFIKPFTNGCGKIGHVWLVYKSGANASPETLESHGGAGVDSRPWDTFILRKEVFETFQLPVK